MGFSNNTGRKKLVSEINVTPLVDVMLVLLIIFMVTAPMMTQGLDVDLPETTSKALRQKENPIVITIDANGKVNINGDNTPPSLVFQELKKFSPEKKAEPIYLRADKKVPYGTVAALMADIKNAGFDKLGMITKPTEKKK